MDSISSHIPEQTHVTLPHADRPAVLGLLPTRAPSAAPPPVRSGRRPHGEVHRRDTIFRRSLALADVLSIGFALVLCVNVLGDDALRPLALFALPLVIVACKIQRLYDRDELLINKTTIDQAPQLFQLATVCTLLIFLLQDRFIHGDLGSMQLLALWASLFAFAVVGRRIARAVARRLSSVERCLFVGTEDSCTRLAGKLASVGGHAGVVGRMSLGCDPDDELVEVARDTLHRLIEDLDIHRVIVEPNESSPQATLDFVREAKATGARVSLLPRILEVVGSSIELDDINGLTLLAVRQFGLSRSSKLLKRSFDVCGATLGLVLLSPLLAVVALLVRLDSRGPVFYRQQRVGRAGRAFVMWKFRTMVRGADELKADLCALNEADGVFKIAADPRLTRVGGWLRRHSLDELPQLVNVLRGEMSLVGPRPLVRDEDVRITGLDRRRLQLTPGMTGHWQVLGSARVPLAEMVKLDYLYVGSWSLWSDVKILVRTIPHVVAGRGM